MSKLKKILEEREMTQRELFALIKEKCHTPVPLYQISKICSGKATNYTISTLIKICAALMVTPNEILSKEDYQSLFVEDLND